MSNDLSLTISGESAGALSTASITLPNDGVLYHLIEDKDFRSIMKIQSPRALLIAVAAGGYVAGEFRTILDVISRYKDESNIDGLISLSITDLVYLSCLILTAALFLIFSFIAYRCGDGMKEVLKRISSRPPVRLNLTQPPNTTITNLNA